MRHLKTFGIFESETSYGKLTPEMEEFANSIMHDMTVVVETDKRKMSDWVVDQGLQKVTEIYLDSDEFREFTEASVEETEEYQSRVESGEDPKKVLTELTDEAIESQTYWNEFLEDGGYDTSEMEEIQGDIKYIDRNGDEYIFNLPSTWTEVQRQSIPTIDIKGSAAISRYKGSFLPFRIRDLEELEFPEDINRDFQRTYSDDIMGDLGIYNTNLIALEKGPIEGLSLFVDENPRLISLEAIKSFGVIEIQNNCLDPDILRKSMGLIPGSEESIEYYESLLKNPQASKFDGEQIEFILERIGHNGGIQKIIDQDPEGSVIFLQPIWKKIKTLEKYKDLHFPKDLSVLGDLKSDLGDIGL